MKAVGLWRCHTHQVLIMQCPPPLSSYGHMCNGVLQHRCKKCYILHLCGKGQSRNIQQWPFHRQEQHWWRPVTCHLSPVTCHLSPVTCHLSVFAGIFVCWQRTTKNSISCCQQLCRPCLGNIFTKNMTVWNISYSIFCILYIFFLNIVPNIIK